MCMMMMMIMMSSQFEVFLRCGGRESDPEGLRKVLCVCVCVLEEQNTGIWSNRVLNSLCSVLCSSIEKVCGKTLTHTHTHTRTHYKTEPLIYTLNCSFR